MENSCLRDVVPEDMDLLFAWANEPGVRANSFSTSLISYEEHKAWFEKILCAKDIRQYIYMCGDETVGQVRVAVSGDLAEVSYSICAGKRNMGYGKDLLQMLKNQVKQDFPQVKRLTAKVKPDNIASRKAFLSVGYEGRYEVYELDIATEA